MTGPDTYLTHALFIFLIYQLHYIIRDHTGNCFRCKISNCSRFTKNKQKEGQAKSYPKRNPLVKIDNETLNHFVKWSSGYVYAPIRQSDVICVIACQ